MAMSARGAPSGGSARESNNAPLKKNVPPLAELPGGPRPLAALNACDGSNSRLGLVEAGRAGWESEAE